MTVRRTGEHSSSQLSASVITKPIRVLVYGRADRVYYMRCTCRSVGLTRDWPSCRAVPRQRVQSVITSVRPSLSESADDNRESAIYDECAHLSGPVNAPVAHRGSAISRRFHHCIAAGIKPTIRRPSARPSDHARIVHRRPLERHCCP